ncbi:hypothetical protein DCAR_0314222 [Daucus carota subsp. sativus]|uniref:RING-type E3 ubiquitin transferase n=2 Tax=Daucus carota subsp. sativus TaxID=79200 RepID=A0AAF0WRY0_DAUCS|nr:PREDICTED: U-box domain-containing protein 3 [Daucus carota subsp. sativus]WOG94925.1 hypothetical protein DCAR_0314222 [Daucus carota subsp. sativus]
MDTKSVSCLINTISRFLHLLSSFEMKNMPAQNGYRNIASSLKILKLILDNVVESKVSSDEILCKECEILDVAVNEAREFIENWSPQMSKFCSVLGGEPLLLNIQGSSVRISHILCRLLESSPSSSSLSEVQHCKQEFQCAELKKISEPIEDALKRQQRGLAPDSDNLSIIIESLSLTADLELLKESIALEKERMKAVTRKSQGDINLISQLVNLISDIRNCLVKYEIFKSINGIAVPLYFRCPLSLRLMLDPVIVATGQTYERTSIQTWLDHGLTICPITRQMLSHTNLIPNYTVKALIANWCEENKINLAECTRVVAKTPKMEALYLQDAIRDDRHHSRDSSNSSSRSSLEVNSFEKPRVNGNPGFSEKNSISNDSNKFDHSSPEQSCHHSRSGSASSQITSAGYVPTISSDGSRTSSKNKDERDLSGEMTSECQSSSSSKRNVSPAPSLTGKQYHSSNVLVERSAGGDRNYPRTLSMPLDSGSNDLTTNSHVKKLIDDLRNPSSEVQTTATAELRYLAKHNLENRNIICNCGAIEPLISLLYSDVKQTQEHAVTALLNLSINGNVKTIIAEAGVIEPLIHVLETGNSGARENAAATVFSISVIEEYRIKIGRSGAVKALVGLLESGTLRGKKDAATALFNLSIYHENKARIVQAGAVKHLVKLIDPESEMVDKAVAVLANLSTVTEGGLAIAREGGIPSLVEIVETGSQRGKENAATILLQLCISSPKYCRLVLQEGAVPPLVLLSQSGTTRAKEKAQQLLCHFRNQREGGSGRGKT